MLENKKFFIKTHGCQMNEYDSGKLTDVLKINLKMIETKEPQDADLLLLNTCSIREKAQEKVFHQLGRWKKLKDKKPSMLIAVGGCVASQEGKSIRSRAPSVDIIFGPQTIHRIPKMIKEIYSSDVKTSVDVSFPEIEKFDYLPSSAKKAPSAYLSIMEGCSKYCTFCVVPYTRGTEVSRPLDDILLEINSLVDNGAKEIILLGQNVNAYKFQDNNREYKLSDLLLELNGFDQIERVRYTTSHPKDMTEDLINVYKKSSKLMPLVHLPVQSGSNKILKSMNRKHTIEEYLKVYESLKEINPNVEFSSDFIIGYPGEDEDDFNKTMELIEKIGFINSYSFIFSARPGTVAADLTQVNAVKSKERLEIIQKKLFENQIKKNKSLENKILNVLVENIMKDGIKLFGRTEYMTSVIFDGDIDNIGKIVQVEITSSNQNSLFGKLVESSKKKVA